MEGVVYLLRGDSHVARLLVSVDSLRKFWAGDVTIVCTDKVGSNYATLMANRYQLNVEERFSKGFRKHTSFVHKTDLSRYTPYSHTVFLDCDTMVVGDIVPLFPLGDEMVLTTYGNWVSTGKIMKGRISNWGNAAPEQVERMLKRSWPALNTGVFAFTDKTIFMQDWFEFTKRNVSFICDEIAAQLMYPDYPVRLMDDRYNFSPKNGTFAAKSDVAVYHFHGKKHLFPAAIDIWLPAFRSLYNNNVCGVADWAPAGDKRLRKYMEDNEF